MPLVDLKTDLKSLKYGMDRPGGGSSRQPFIQTSTRNSFDLPIEKLGNTIAGIPAGSDFILRGGVLAPARAAKDVSRLFQLFTQTPRGLTFTAKTNLLSRTSVATEASGGPGYGFGAVNQGIYTPLSTLGQAGLGWSGTHLNLLGIDPTNLTPFGLIKYEAIARAKNAENANFITTGIVQYPNPNYKEFNASPGSILGAVPPPDTLIISNGEPQFLSKTVSTSFFTNRLLSLTKNKINQKTDDPDILSYSGGPGSTLGVGKTNIKFAKGSRTGLNNPLSVSKPGFFYGKDKKDSKINYLGALSGVSSTNSLDPLVDNFINLDNQFTPETKVELSSSAIINYLSASSGVSVKANLDPLVDNFISPENQLVPEITPTYGSETLSASQISELAAESIAVGPTYVTDFRNKLAKKLPGTNTQTPAFRNGSLSDSLDYSNPQNRIETRVNLGDPGNPNIDRSNYTKGGGSARTGVDKINSLYLYKKENVTSSPVKNDLVKFRIATVDPDNPKLKTYAHFRAYINGLTDQYGANWNTFKYMGRGEEFFNYEGFTREMSLGWTVVAQSKEELSIMYQKLNYLASTLAPNYSSEGFMRGNIHHLTIGGYVYESPGIITNLSFTVPDDSTWDIGIPVDETVTSNTSGTVSSDSKVKELPHRIEVQMSFKPIHKFLPETVGSSFDTDNPLGILGGNQITQRFISLEDSSATRDNSKLLNNLYNDGIPQWALESPTKTP
tara:strand:- start:11026 stop:13209 length:2184 start_codon:yes stop_codon:yes gene_type:complete